MRELRAKEDAKRQEAYLDEAYRERLSRIEDGHEEDDSDWDPIEDVIEDERGAYIDLIKHFLFMTEDAGNDSDTKALEPPTSRITQNGRSATANDTRVSKKTKKPKQKAEANGSVQNIPDKAAHDTASQVCRRLKEGVKLNYSRGLHVAGTIDNPSEIHDKTPPLPDEEIDLLLKDMAEIKHLLFCRLVLSHATVLPAAIQASSVDEFMNNKEVTDADLRDLCLKMENPGLQEVRDACADLDRGDKEESDDYSHVDDEVEVDEVTDKMKKFGVSKERHHRALPKAWMSQREKQVRKNAHQGEHLSISLRLGLKTHMLTLARSTAEAISNLGKCASKSAGSISTIIRVKRPSVAEGGCNSVSSQKTAIFTMLSNCAGTGTNSSI